MQRMMAVHRGENTMNTKQIFGILGMIGLIGLTLTIALNFVALLIFHRPSAHFFVGKWWSDWFVNYVSWSVFTLIGFAGQRFRRA